MNTQKLNDEMFGSRKNYVLPVLFIGLLIVLACVALSSIPAHAMGITDGGTNDYIPTHETASPCVPYTHSMVNKGSGFWSHTITLTHGACNGMSAVKHSDKPVDNVPAVNTPAVDVHSVTSDKPASQPKEPKVKNDKKAKCNNGEGNGGEGCSPAKSPNANNDENNTTPKQDKSH